METFWINAAHLWALWRYMLIVLQAIIMMNTKVTDRIYKTKIEYYLQYYVSNVI